VVRGLPTRSRYVMELQLDAVSAGQVPNLPEALANPHGYPAYPGACASAEGVWRPTIAGAS
jgi:hypothetical protein